MWLLRPQQAGLTLLLTRPSSSQEQPKHAGPLHHDGLLGWLQTVCGGAQAWLTTHGPQLQGMAPRQALWARALHALEQHRPEAAASELPWEGRMDSPKLQDSLSAAFASDYRAQCAEVPLQPEPHMPTAARLWRLRTQHV